MFIRSRKTHSQETIVKRLHKKLRNLFYVDYRDFETEFHILLLEFRQLTFFLYTASIKLKTKNAAFVCIDVIHTYKYTRGGLQGKIFAKNKLK